GVLLARLGRQDAARADARSVLLLDSSPPTLYQAACIYALTAKHDVNDRVEACRLLSAALRGGFGFDLLDDDKDLDSLRDLPEYRRLVAAAKGLRTGAH